MKKISVNIFLGNLRPVTSKLVSSNFDKKKNDPLYIIHYSHQALRYRIVYIDENCEAAMAIILNNLDFGKNYIPIDKVLEIFAM